MPFALQVQKDIEDHDRRQVLGDYGCRSSARDSPGKDRHEKDIQEEIGDCRDHKDIEGGFGIAEGPQRSVDRIVDQLGGDAQQADAQVSGRGGDDLLRRLQEPQAHGHKQEAGQSHGQADPDHGKEDGLDAAGQFLVGSASVQMRNHDADAGGQSDDKVDDHGYDQGSCPDPGQGIRPGAPSHQSCITDAV